MGKSYNSADYSDYDNIVYFRWKALIRSQEYQTFIREAGIDDLHEKRESIENEIWDKENYLRCSISDFLESVSAYGPPSDDEALVDECEELMADMQAVADREEELMEAAEDKFGLIVFDLDDLNPEERSVKTMTIAFSDYLPHVPENYFGGLSRLRGQFIIKSVSGADIRGGRIQEGDGYKLFAINTRVPLGLIIDELKKELREVAKTRSDRKDFLKWHEAFQVWDLQKKTDNLVATAKAMGWSANRKGDSYTDEELRGLAWKKKEVADELIDLAGKGKFKDL